MSAATDTECTCDTCKGYCSHTPGWFAPGEAEKAATLKGLTLEAFFRDFLMVDYWQAGDGLDADVFLLSPQLVGEGGGMAPSDPRGRCVFFVDGLCDIHEAKPLECRRAHHSIKRHQNAVVEEHLAVAKMWNNEADQARVRALLGEEPWIPEGSMFGGLFGGMFGGAW